MHTKHLTALLLILGSAVTLSATTDGIDRIILAIGVDSIHSENEEARTRQAVAAALEEVATKELLIVKRAGDC